MRNHHGHQRASIVATVSALTLMAVGWATQPTMTARTPWLASVSPISWAQAATAAATHPMKVGLVVSSAGLNDDGYNHLAYQGLQRAERTLNIQGSITVPPSSLDYVQALTKYASQGYDVVIAVGYLMEDAVSQVSKLYPNTHFVILDDTLPNRSNVTNVTFQTEDAGYLAGALAGLLEQSHVPDMNAQNVVGIVGGESIPEVNQYVAGFEQGAKKTDPTIRVIVEYAHSFISETAGSDAANQEIVDGADVIFQVAGQAGLGVFQACKTGGIYAIGVDTNQSSIAPKIILTSAMKGIDSTVYGVIREAKDNALKPGIDNVGLQDGDVRLAPFLSTVPKRMAREISVIESQIESGKIQVSATLPPPAPPKKK